MPLCRCCASTSTPANMGLKNSGTCKHTCHHRIYTNALIRISRAINDNANAITDNTRLNFGNLLELYNFILFSLYRFKHFLWMEVFIFNTTVD